MEIKALTDLGITEEAAKKVVEINAAELAAETAKVTAANEKLTAANASIKDLSEKVKAFDGVDLEALKKDAKDWETKYNNDIKELSINHALDLELTAAKAKDIGIVKSLFDKAQLKLGDDGKLSGFSEQLTKLKTEKQFLFDDEADGT